MKKHEKRTVPGHKEVISYEGNGVIFITEITPFLFFRTYAEAFACMGAFCISAINALSSSSVGRSIIPTAVK